MEKIIETMADVLIIVGFAGMTVLAVLIVAIIVWWAYSELWKR